MRRPDGSVICRSLCSGDPEPVALLLGTFLIGWGLWIGSGWGRTVVLYGGLQDEVLGLLMAGTGVAMFVAMLWDLHRTYVVTLVLGTMAWGYLAWSGATTSAFQSSGIVVYGLLALWTSWVWVRVVIDDARLKDLSDVEVPSWRDSLRT